MPEVNLLRPKGIRFKKISYLICLIIGLWALMVYGFQILLILFQRDSMGSSFLTDARFLGFPFHYWFTGQFCIIGFLLLCILFNRLFDRLSYSHASAPKRQE